MNRLRLTVLAAALFLGGATFSVTASQAAPAPTGYIPVTPRPCATESGPGPCYWDAGERGNGQGYSFVLKDGFTYYLNGDRVAH